MTRTHTLGDLQLAIMHVLWQHGEATVTLVHQALLDERGLAPTTIATMLKKMEKKGIVTHRSEGRKFIYQPLINEDEVQRTMVSQLKDRLFGGKVTALVSHLLDEHDIDPEELERLRKLIDTHEKKGDS